MRVTKYWNKHLILFVTCLGSWLRFHETVAYLYLPTANIYYNLNIFDRFGGTAILP